MISIKDPSRLAHLRVSASWLLLRSKELLFSAPFVVAEINWGSANLDWVSLDMEPESGVDSLSSEESLGDGELGIRDFQYSRVSLRFFRMSCASG